MSNIEKLKDLCDQSNPGEGKATVAWAVSEIEMLRKKLAEMKTEIGAVLKFMGNDAVRVCEGGGPENLAASLAVSVHKLGAIRAELKNDFDGLIAVHAKCRDILLPLARNPGATGITEVCTDVATQLTAIKSGEGAEHKQLAVKDGEGLANLRCYLSGMRRDTLGYDWVSWAVAEIERLTKPPAEDLIRRIKNRYAEGDPGLSLDRSVAEQEAVRPANQWDRSDRAYLCWQYWRNVSDADVGRYLSMFTPIDMTEVRRLASLMGKDINQAKVRLADEMTAALWGQANVAPPKPVIGVPLPPGLHSCPDAREWAKYFKDVWPHGCADEDCMVGWFANAMEATRTYDAKVWSHRGWQDEMHPDEMRRQQDIVFRPSTPSATELGQVVFIHSYPLARARRLADLLAECWIRHGYTLVFGSPGQGELARIVMAVTVRPEGRWAHRVRNDDTILNDGAISVFDREVNNFELVSIERMSERLVDALAPMIMGPSDGPVPGSARHAYVPGEKIADALVRIGETTSIEYALRLIDGSSVRVNGVVAQAGAVLTDLTLQAGRVHIQVGKRREYFLYSAPVR